jgi:hypothetical protein
MAGNDTLLNTTVKKPVPQDRGTIATLGRLSGGPTRPASFNTPTATLDVGKSAEGGVVAASERQNVSNFNDIRAKLAGQIALSGASLKSGQKILDRFGALTEGKSLSGTSVNPNSFSAQLGQGSLAKTWGSRLKVGGQSMEDVARDRGWKSDSAVKLWGNEFKPEAPVNPMPASHQPQQGPDENWASLSEMEATRENMGAIGAVIGGTPLFDGGVEAANRSLAAQAAGDDEGSYTLDPILNPNRKGGSA